MKLNVEGMSCGGCVNSVRRILVKNLEVDDSSIDVDLDGGTATIPDDVDDAQVAAALEKLTKAGFPSQR